jgi:chemotaxis protein methyltransferase CheR
MGTFEEILERLERELGLVVPDSQRAILARQMPAATREQLLGQLTNGQTYFFRHPEQCQAFEGYLRDSDPLGQSRIWSAGCSTGCEAFSIAIMLDRVRRPGRVLGTDISAERLAEAEAGVYRDSRLLRITETERAKYFLPAGDGLWRVNSSLRGMVSFAQENLAQDQASGPGLSQTWDVIFCRNVLIYFDEAGAREVLARLVARLEVGGLLVLGYPEAFFGLYHPELTLMAARTAIFTKVGKAVEATLPTPLLTLPVVSVPGPFQEGIRLHAMGRLTEARRCLREAEDDEPHFCLVHYFFARLHDEMGQKHRAVASLRRFFETYREDDPAVLSFISRNGLTTAQLNLAATRLRERLERGYHRSTPAFEPDRGMA